MTVEARTSKRRFIGEKLVKTEAVGEGFQHQFIDVDTHLGIPHEVKVRLVSEDFLAVFEHPAIDTAQLSHELGLPVAPVSSATRQEAQRTWQILEREKINERGIQYPGEKKGEIVRLRWTQSR